MPPIQNPKAAPQTKIQNLKRRLVEGIQVITGEGVLSGSGHLSARIPGTETFLIHPRFAGVLADPKDICTVTFDGKRIAGKGPIPSESPIHAALYRARPDVGSVIHCHARYSILVGLLDKGLIPFNREARIFADGVPVFHDSRGINDFALARRMVENLGPHWATFLRGHGIVVVGQNLPEVLFAALVLEDDAKKTLQAAALGEVGTISREECKTFGAEIALERRAQRAWNYFCSLEAKWDKQASTGRSELFP